MFLWNVYYDVIGLHNCNLSSHSNVWTKVLIRCCIYFKIATCSIARMQKWNNKRNRNGTTAWKMKPHTVMQVIWNWNHYGDIILPEQRCISNQQKAKDLWILSLEGTCSNMLYFVALVLGWVTEILSFILNNSGKTTSEKSNTSTTLYTSIPSVPSLQIAFLLSLFLYA